MQAIHLYYDGIERLHGIFIHILDWKPQHIPFLYNPEVPPRQGGAGNQAHARLLAHPTFCNFPTCVTRYHFLSIHLRLLFIITDA